MNRQRIQRTIKGTPYSVAKNELGYGFTANGRPSDRFHRNYQVFCDEQGKPLRCSCPHNFYSGKVCKHMQEVLNMTNYGGEDCNCQQPTTLDCPKHGPKYHVSDYPADHPHLQRKMKRPRWYRVKLKNTNASTVYARKGFGEDGLLVAIYSLEHNPCNTGIRLTVEQCRERYEVLGVAANDEEIEARFSYELHR